MILQSTPEKHPVSFQPVSSIGSNIGVYKHYKTRGGSSILTYPRIFQFIERSIHRTFGFGEVSLSPIVNSDILTVNASKKIHKLATFKFLGCLDMVENKKSFSMFYLFYLDLKTECLKKKGKQTTKQSQNSVDIGCFNGLLGYLPVVVPAQLWKLY